MPKVCLDPGHGGRDPGAVGNGLRESDLALDISLKLKTLLEAQGIEVIMTRRDDSALGNEINSDLQRRCDIANNGAVDLYVSIHINAGGGTGVEVLIPGLGGGAERCAKLVLPHLAKSAQWTNRGIKQQNVKVLRDTNMPAILTENGFIDHGGDAAKLKNPSVRQSIAEAHAKGITDYFGITYAQTVQAPAQVTTPAVPSHADEFIPPTGENIHPLPGGLGWIETLKAENRLIIHLGRSTYISLDDGSIRVYARGKESIKLI